MNRPLMNTNASPKEAKIKLSSDVTMDDWERIATTLWHLLDDIDTASDMFKPEKSNFYSYAMRKATERHKVMSSDGYDLKVVATPTNPKGEK